MENTQPSPLEMSVEPAWTDGCCDVLGEKRRWSSPARSLSRSTRRWRRRGRRRWTSRLAGEGVSWRRWGTRSSTWLETLRVDEGASVLHSSHFHARTQRPTTPPTPPRPAVNNLRQSSSRHFLFSTHPVLASLTSPFSVSPRRLQHLVQLLQQECWPRDPGPPGPLEVPVTRRPSFRCWGSLASPVKSSL